jgi:hypothetical protein
MQCLLMSFEVEISSMFKYSHSWSSYRVTNVTGLILLVGMMYQFISPALAGEAPVYNPIVGNPTTATYSDANQSDLIIHTTSNGTSIAEPLSNVDKVPTSDSNTEDDRTPQLSQESPSAPLEGLLSGGRLSSEAQP